MVYCIHHFSVGIEGFHCIQRCPQCWNRGVPLYTEVSSFQGVRVYISKLDKVFRNGGILAMHKVDIFFILV